MGLTVKSQGYVESICSGGVLRLLTRTQSEVCDFFEKLAWDTYAFEQARGTLENPTYQPSWPDPTLILIRSSLYLVS